MKSKLSAVRAVCFVLLFFFLFWGSKSEIKASGGSLYHVHTGSTAGGGCFGSPVYCGGQMHEQTLNPHGCGISASSGGCPHCGCWYEPPSSKYPSGCAHCNCPKPKVTRCQRCGAEGGGGTCGRIINYNPSCGKNESTLLAKMHLQKSTEEWCKELSLEVIPEVFYENEAGKPYLFSWNAEEPKEDRKLAVKENGIYQCVWKLLWDGNVKDLAANAEIYNIDYTAPKLYIEEGEETFVKERILQIESEDLQEDGKPGAGLHEQPYSFDAGQTWQESNQITVSDNRIYALAVRDILENTNTEQIEVTNIDNTPPQTEVTVCEKEIFVKAEDLQEDGSKGCGLDETPYSFDGERTWVQENRIIVQNAGEYDVSVRDKLGNTTRKKAVIKEAVTEKPKEEIKEEGREEVTEEEIPTISQNIAEEVLKDSNEYVEADSVEKTISENKGIEKRPIAVAIEKKETDKIRKNTVPLRQKEKSRKTEKFIKAAVIAGSSFLLISFFLVLLYLWYVSARIYEILEGNKKHFLGISFVLLEKEYACEIPIHIWENASSNYLEIRLNSIFAKKHHLEKLILILDEDKKMAEIQQEIMLRMH